MITELSIKNFKSWKDPKPLHLAPITALFGSNSSGKSSFLQLLLMLKQTARSSDRSSVVHFGDELSLTKLGTFKDTVFNHTLGATMQFGLRWGLPKMLKIDNPEKKGETLFQDDKIEFGVEVSENTQGRLFVNQLSYDFSGYRFSMKKKTKGTGYEIFANHHETRPHSDFTFKFKRNPGHPWDLPAPVKCYGFPDQVKAYYQNAGFLAEFGLEFEKLFSRLFYLGPLRENPQRQYSWSGAQPDDMGSKGERVVDALLASRDKDPIPRGKGKVKWSVEEYVAYWLRELGLIHNFKVKQIADNSNLYQVLVQQTPSSTEVLLTDVGFGVSQILPVLTICYYVPEGSTILIEQPEIHLHPSVQSGLADVFIDACETRKVQFIIESHSEHLLMRLQRRIAEGKTTRDNTALYFCQVSDGQSSLTPLHLDLFGKIQNWPEKFFGDPFEEMSAITLAHTHNQRREGK